MARGKLCGSRWCRPQSRHFLTPNPMHSALCLGGTANGTIEARARGSGLHSARTVQSCKWACERQSATFAGWVNVLIFLFFLCCRSVLPCPCGGVERLKVSDGPQQVNLDKKRAIRTSPSVWAQKQFGAPKSFSTHTFDPFVVFSG